MRYNIGAIVLVGVFVTIFIVHRIQESPQHKVSHALGGRKNVEVISSPDNALLFVTSLYVAQLTNGPEPERFLRIEPGVAVSNETIQILKKILLDPTCYSEEQDKWQDTGAMAPDIVIRYFRGDRTVDVNLNVKFNEIAISWPNGMRKICGDSAGLEARRQLTPTLKQLDSRWFPAQIHANPKN